MSLKSDGVTKFINEDGLSLRGWIGEDLDVWGPDARVELTVGVANVTIVQHTEGRGESSNAMLDLSVSGLDGVVESVGGWLGVHGASDAGAPPPECRGSAPARAPRYLRNKIGRGSRSLQLLSIG